jgi:hypothetical protein
VGRIGACADVSAGMEDELRGILLKALEADAINIDVLTNCSLVTVNESGAGTGLMSLRSLATSTHMASFERSRTIPFSFASPASRV